MTEAAARPMGESGAPRRFAKHKKRVLEDEVNPCVKEHQMSLKCMSEVYGDPQKCTPYFENYRNCRKFWKTITHERKRKGIKPALPPVSERAAIKENNFDKKAAR